MKNHFIRAKRTLESVGCAPEFANNHLLVDVTFTEVVPDAHDYSVRVYSSDYHLMGISTEYLNGKKNVARLHFDILSSNKWVSGDYHVVVCRNGSPRWLAKLSLNDDDERSVRADLEDVNVDSKDKFFAEIVCSAKWWKVYQEFNLSEAFNEMFMETIYKHFHDFMTEEIMCLPNLYVIGEPADAKKFAELVLGGYVSDDNSDKCYSFRLVHLFSGTLSWNDMMENLNKCRAAIVDLSGLEYDDNLICLLNKFGQLVYQNEFRNIPFIFYGTSDVVEGICFKCRYFYDMYRDETVFFLPDEDCTPLVEEKPQISDVDDFVNTLKDYIDTNKYMDAVEKDNVVSPSCDYPNVDNMTYTEQCLQKMVGLQRLKTEIDDARTMAMFTKERRDLFLESTGDCRYHMLFLGNPGTGKTSVAKLIGEMFHSMGLLSLGHTVETNRSKLVGEYIGQTEQKTNEAIERARGGVLFIDEAYTLIGSNDDPRDFGKEVINALLPVLSEPNPDIIVILAGYEDKLQHLLRFNPGLDGRFPLKFHFDDYSVDELMKIAYGIFKGHNYVLTEGANKRLRRLVECAVNNKDKNFGNGRWVHNLIEHSIVKNMAKRVMSMPHSTNDRHLLCSIEECDIAEAELNLQQSKVTVMIPSRRIGFTG